MHELSRGLFDIACLSDAETHCASAENVYGGKGKGGMAELTSVPQPEVPRIGQRWEGPNPCARDLGRGFKVRPSITLPRQSTTTILDAEGPGVVQHVWATVEPRRFRDLIVRMYWDAEPAPSVEVPLGDFFCNGWCMRNNVLTLAINVNPSGGLNCFFPMPFAKHARVTIENRAPEDVSGFYYAITYATGKLDDSAAYFHAQFRRARPLAYGQDHVIVEGVRGRGHYVGTYLAWQQNSDGWWGEGEFKAFLDGDLEYPTICGTGTEDYFGGAWGFGANYSAPFLGYADLSSLSQPGRPLGRHGNRHSMYRFHLLDPIRFRSDLKVTMQALGWRSEGRYLPLQDDIASVAYWYQVEPHAPFPALPNRDELEVI